MTHQNKVLHFYHNSLFLLLLLLFFPSYLLPLWLRKDISTKNERTFVCIQQYLCIVHAYILYVFIWLAWWLTETIIIYFNIQHYSVCMQNILKFYCLIARLENSHQAWLVMCYEMLFCLPQMHRAVICITIAVLSAQTNLHLSSDLSN